MHGNRPVKERPDHAREFIFIAAQIGIFFPVQSMVHRGGVVNGRGLTQAREQYCTRYSRTAQQHKRVKARSGSPHGTQVVYSDGVRGMYVVMERIRYDYTSQPVHTRLTPVMDQSKRPLRINLTWPWPWHRKILVLFVGGVNEP
jgi:hypothetical protein